MALIIAILGYLLNSISVTTDKFLLTKGVPNPLTYVFYVNAVSLVTLFLLPFSHIPSLSVFILISTSTIIWTTAAWLLFKALKTGAVARVIPVVGTLTPLFLLVYYFYSQNITFNQTWGAIILIFGLILITIPDWKGKISLMELNLEVLSSLLFAVYYFLLKQAFSQTDFLTVLAWSRMILVPAVITILCIPFLRRKVLQPDNTKTRFNSLTGIFFLLGQIAGGISGVFLNLAISLSNPVLISSLQGVQYVFLFIFTILLVKKFPKIFHFQVSFFNISTKVAGILLIFLGLFTLASTQNPNKETVFGLTFSPRYAYQMGLDPKLTYLKILDELKVKSIRIPVYWDEIEIFPMQINFSQVDYYISEAAKRNVNIILVLGLKQPRWPECFAPDWIKSLTADNQQSKVLQLVKNEVEHFKTFSNISAWQIENEPFLDFGSCDFISKLPKIDVIKKEVAIVKGVDKRPVLITDSGELGSWINPIKYSDIFGTTLYRQVWNPLLGAFGYPLPPVFYSLKDKLIRDVTGKTGTTIISELQAEPWITDSKIPSEADLNTQKNIFPASKFKTNIAYAKETGFSEVYLWGVEWWYYMAKNGNPQYLEYAKSLF